MDPRKKRGLRVNRALCILAAGAILAGCGDPVTSRPVGATGQDAAQTEPDRLVNQVETAITGLTFTMYDWDDAEGQRRAPSVIIRAEEGNRTGPDQWRLRGIEARFAKPDTDPLLVTAASGEFEETVQRAVLRNDISGSWAGLEFTMEEFVWENETGVGQSALPVRIAREGTQLDAAALVTEPEAGNFKLIDGAGRLQLARQNGERTDPGGTPDVESSQTPVSEGFTEIRDLTFGALEGNVKTGALIERMTGGVSMVFAGEGAQSDLHVNADNVYFEYAGDDREQPSLIRLEGNVHLHNDEMDVRAGRGTVDFESGEAEFTEKPIMESVAFGVTGGRAEVVRYNLNTGSIFVGSGDFEKVPLDTGKN